MVEAIAAGPYGLKQPVERLFRCVVLDEAHELTPMQLHFLYSICDRSVLLVAALDPSQAIDQNADTQAEPSLLRRLFNMPAVALSTARGRTQRLHEVSEAQAGCGGQHVHRHGQRLLARTRTAARDEYCLGGHVRH